VGNDLPDYQTSVETTLSKVTSIQNGLDADKAASPSVGDAYLATDTGLLYVCFVAGTWVSFAIPADDVTQSTPTRVVDTVYQNTTGKIKVVTLTINQSNTTGAIWLYCDAVNGATTLIIVGNFSTASTYSITFVVPPNYYWQAKQQAAGATINRAVEWNLL